MSTTIKYDPMKPTCSVCQRQKRVVRIMGYYEHQKLDICKRCLRFALTVPDGGTMNTCNGKLIALEPTKGKS